MPNDSAIDDRHDDRHDERRDVFSRLSRRLHSSHSPSPSSSHQNPHPIRAKIRSMLLDGPSSSSSSTNGHTISHPPSVRHPNRRSSEPLKPSTSPFPGDQAKHESGAAAKVPPPPQQQQQQQQNPVAADARGRQCSTTPSRPRSGLRSRSASPVFRGPTPLVPAPAQASAQAVPAPAPAPATSTKNAEAIDLQEADRKLAPSAPAPAESNEPDAGSAARDCSRVDADPSLGSDESSEEQQSSDEDKEPRPKPEDHIEPHNLSEEARAQVQDKVYSLLPPVDHTVDKAAVKRPGVRPFNSFEESSESTPAASDEEAEYSEFKKAQNLAIGISPIDSHMAYRVIRTIVRGDFTTVLNDATDNNRRLRTYLVATDLSAESVYALEWTIGTILRDGDTLYAIYAIEDDTVPREAGDQAVEATSSIQTSSFAVDEFDAVVSDQTAKSAPGNSALGAPLASGASGHGPSHLSIVTHPPDMDGSNGSGGNGTAGLSKPEAERKHAIEAITQTCVRLLRKTTLQVRIAVEVIGARTPKEMIIETVCPLPFPNPATLCSFNPNKCPSRLTAWSQQWSSSAPAVAPASRASSSVPSPTTSLPSRPYP